VELITFPYGQYISGNVVYSSLVMCNIVYYEIDVGIYEKNAKYKTDFTKKSRLAATLPRG